LAVRAWVLACATLGRIGRNCFRANSREFVMKHCLAIGFVVVLLPACSGAPEPTGSATGSASSRNGKIVTVGQADTVAQNPIQHIIVVQFDNVHFRRDNPNVPSDLEQMPNLLSFLEGNGTLLSNHHTPLISHTADDILTTLTGVYGDRHGQPVANSFGFFLPPGFSGIDGFASSFAYWTDLVNPKTDPTFNMLTADGKNAPAPWVPFTRGGLNVGAVSTANIVFENVKGDINNVFGPNSPQAAEAKANFAQAVADFEGIAIHCAANDAVCSSANGGRADVLPQEPFGYTGFNALYGNAFVAPVISPGGPVTDLDGNVITDSKGNIGFPGFGGISASQALGYVAAMQEHGVPVTIAYIADAHDNHAIGQASGPGQADYVARLAAYNEAWGKFFARLQADGITKANTLFVITSDENDHFAGGPPSPANCDGINVPCTYAKIGEIDTNLTDLLQAVDPALAGTPFDIHFDMAPTFYVSGNPAAGSSIAREYEHAAAQLTAVSPISGNTDKLALRLADPVEEKLLHMVTADPQRTPTFVMFGNPDYFFQTFGTPDLVENPGFAWNHGGFQPEITHTWLGMVGPGVLPLGEEGLTWSDHTDIRPTILALAGLKDDYAHDGRVLAEVLDRSTLSSALQGPSGAAFVAVAAAYKQINASVGALGVDTLVASTTALSGDDATYAAIEAHLTDLTNRRNALAATMIAALEAAAFQGQPIDFREAGQLVFQAALLLAEAHSMAQ
jgi:hypothetical protein